MQNISPTDCFLAHIRYWKHFVGMILKVQGTYHNSLKILTSVLQGKFPVEATLKNGKHVKLQSFNAMYFIAHAHNLENIQYDVDNDVVTIFFPESKEKKSVTLYGGINNGDIVYGFLKDDYGKLPVKGKTVIDIGSNIGDTPIYFTLNGATKVIGLEPYPKNYDIANKNIAYNNFSDKITLLLAGCAGNIGNITINPDHESNIESTLNESTQGIKIPLLTLEQIIDKYDVPPQSILKMDCEGCEYDTIKSASEETLKKFSQIQIEYHLGFKDLKEKLEKCGFRVVVGEPRATDVINTYIEKFYNTFSSQNKKESHADKRKHKIGYAGFIYAINDQKT